MLLSNQITLRVQPCSALGYAAVQPLIHFADAFFRIDVNSQTPKFARGLPILGRR